jgi:hypothetical protein
MNNKAMDKPPSHVLGNALIDVTNSVIGKLMIYEQEIKRLRMLVNDCNESLSFVRSWSKHAPLNEIAPDSSLSKDFWAWAEGWDCDLELRIEAALDGTDSTP